MKKSIKLSGLILFLSVFFLNDLRATTPTTGEPKVVKKIKATIASINSLFSIRRNEKVLVNEKGVPVRMLQIEYLEAENAFKVKYFNPEKAKYEFFPRCQSFGKGAFYALIKKDQAYWLVGLPSKAMLKEKEGVERYQLTCFSLTPEGKAMGERMLKELQNLNAFAQSYEPLVQVTQKRYSFEGSRKLLFTL